MANVERPVVAAQGCGDGDSGASATDNQHLKLSYRGWGGGLVGHGRWSSGASFGLRNSSCDLSYLY
jgi:hypothetical protein